MSWSDEDRAKALAYRRYEAQRCRGCGTRQKEWDADRFAYVAQSRVCAGCELIAQERRNAPEGQEGVLVWLAHPEEATVPDEPSNGTG